MKNPVSKTCGCGRHHTGTTKRCDACKTYAKKHYQEHREEHLVYQQKYRETHRDYYTNYYRDYYAKNKERILEYNKLNRPKINRKQTLNKKVAVWDHYFNGVLACQLCGKEYDIRVLHLHHVNGDAAVHRKELNTTATAYYVALRNAGFPPLELQSLCPTCHTLVHLGLVEK